VPSLQRPISGLFWRGGPRWLFGSAVAGAVSGAQPRYLRAPSIVNNRLIAQNPANRARCLFEAWLDSLGHAPFTDVWVPDTRLAAGLQGIPPLLPPRILLLRAHPPCGLSDMRS